MALTIAQAVWLVGVHSIIHGIVGIFVITTSFYVNYHPGITNAFLAANILFIVLGFCIFCVVVWRHPIVTRIFGVILVIVAIYYLITAIIYFIEYLPFFANSVFDAYLFYSSEDCWAGPDKSITIWHILVILLMIPVFLWFYYCYLFFKLANDVCFTPCAQQQSSKRKRLERYIDEVSCQGGKIKRRERWYSKIKPGCPPPCPPPGPPPCPPPCPPPSCPLPCPPPCPPPTCPRPCKKPTFTLTLKPAKLSSC